MLTKADLIKGFEAFFGGLSTAAREQVWGTTFALDARVDAKTIAREISTLATELERRLVPRLEDEDKLAARAEIFRFPAQLQSLSEPIQVLIEAMFGESRYEESAWLRGLYLTSATQEGAPDRPADGGAVLFLRPAATTGDARAARRKTQLLPEEPADRSDLQGSRPRHVRPAGAATPRLDLARRGGGLLLRPFCWPARCSPGPTMTTAMRSQPRQASSRRCRRRSTAVAASPASGGAAGHRTGARRDGRGRKCPDRSRRATCAMLLGHRLRRNCVRAQTDTYDHALRNVLEPRMVALLEATMWRQIRDPEFLLGALKTYRMMTGLSQMDPDFVQDWWVNDLPEFAPVGALSDRRRGRAPACRASAAWRSTTATSRPTRRWSPRR